MNASNLFDRYAAHTDGKRLIAAAVQEVVGMRPNLLIDVGSGTGEIAAYLAPWARQIVAVEPNSDLASMMRERRVPNVRLLEKPIQNVSESLEADVAVLSYFLDVLDPEVWDGVLQNIERLVLPEKPIIAISYLEGCDWDVFSQIVHHRLGTKRSGGFARAVFRLRNIGWDVHVVRILNTRIFGVDLDDLYGVLEFFYKDVLEPYRLAAGSLKPILSSLAGTSQNALVVQEVVFEIYRTGTRSLLRADRS